MDAASDHFLLTLSAACSAGGMDGTACLLRVHRNLHSMLTARGLTVRVSTPNTEEELLQRMGANEPVAECAKGDDESADNGDGGDSGDQVALSVYFHVDAKVGIKALRAIAEARPDGGTVCVVSVEGPTAYTRREAKDAGRDVQFLLYRQLYNDLSSHSMVPAHRRLPAHEQAEVAKRYNITDPSQWPRLLLRDPVAVFYDFSIGDVVEVTRRGTGMQGSTKYYRRVC
jgi:DNA-directed RNA polymerase subunit H (RpoH/RPB5)